VTKPGGKRPLGRLSPGWEDNIKMDLEEVGWGNGLDNCDSGYGQVAGSCECGNERLFTIKCGKRGMKEQNVGLHDVHGLG